jgi:hypothetical protein
MKPTKHFRFATPWYYTPIGNWFFGYWNYMDLLGFPEWGIRILGFEYWEEYWR